MLESMFNPKREEKGPWKMLFIGMLYASLSIILVNWFFSNDEVLKKMYGDYSAWNWINENLKNDERIATFDAAIYYIDNYPNLFYLDGWEAKDLYRVSEPGDFLIYFYKQNITHIFIPAWAKLGNSRHPLYSKLRLKDYLNTDYFPLVYYIGESKIYKVNISKLRGEN